MLAAGLNEVRGPRRPLAWLTKDEPLWSASGEMSDPSVGRQSNQRYRPCRNLKDSTEGDITMSGSATLVRWLLANGLLDRLNLMVHPIAVGKGQRLFEDTPTHRLQLVSQETFSTGVLNLGYAPADT